MARIARLETRTLDWLRVVKKKRTTSPCVHKMSGGKFEVGNKWREREREATQEVRK